MRALIVEDDAPMARLLAIMLDELGIEVCGSEATEQGAISAAARCSPDLMIVDINLRVGTGIAAVKEILRHSPVPHVFVSADLTLLKQQNPTAVMLQKPYGFTQMSEAIQRATAAA
jgi:two-component system, response regulator PdtaR